MTRGYVDAGYYSVSIVNGYCIPLLPHSISSLWSVRRARARAFVDIRSQP